MMKQVLGQGKESSGSNPADSCDCREGGRRVFLKRTAALGVGALAGMVLPGRGAAADGPKSATAPAVPIPDVSITMRSPDAYLVGISPSDIVEIKLADVIKFHGYCAGGVAFAFRAAREAFRALYGTKPPLRQSIRVETSHHCCQAGALAYITGARADFGAERSLGDLILIPPETKMIVFTDKKTGRKVTLKPLFNPHDTFKPLFRRVMKEHDFAPRVRQVLRESVHEYINGPAEKLFQIEMG